MAEGGEKFKPAQKPKQQPVSIRLVVGLGNPGKEYVCTRHNIGFRVVDAVAERWAVPLGLHSKWRAFLGQGGPQGVALMKPQTYMNRSGEAVGAFCRYYRLKPCEVLVVLDDLALPLGRVRLRLGGSSGGQRGLESILAHLGTREVPRLRVGIDAARGHVPDYVLSGFSREEQPVVDGAVLRAVDAVEEACRAGVDSAMNQFNKLSS